MSYRISTIHAHEILDSRGNPTIQASVLLEDGSVGTASVPSGASTGSHEAAELRDGDAKRYGGKGVLKAIRNVHGGILTTLRGMDARRQDEIDEAMIKLDGTSNKRRMGANAILAVSLANAKAAATAKQMPLYAYLRFAFDIPYKKYQLPIPTMNVLNGGVHAGWALDFQEFMIVPKQSTFRERVRCGSEIFHTLGAMLRKKGYSTLVGDEGGYAVPLPSNESALKMLVKAIEAAGYEPGREVGLAMDPAASEFYDAKRKLYMLRSEGKELTSDEMIKMFSRFIKKYPIVSIEDPLFEDDWEGWQKMTAAFPKEVHLVGDDLFVTNVERLEKGIEMQVANAILIKVNQIGTLSEAIESIMLARQAGYAISVSHRSGETEDTTIADIAVATNAEFIKSGSLSRSERLAKYNRLMEIEEELKRS